MQDWPQAFTAWTLLLLNGLYARTIRVQVAFTIFFPFPLLKLSK